jgi:hypothetical protein
MKGYDELLEQFKDKGYEDGGFAYQPPMPGAEYDLFVGAAIRLACEAFNFPWEGGEDYPLGYRYDGFYTNHVGDIHVFFRIDKDCPIMVSFEGISYYEDFKGQQWTADCTTIRKWEV